MMEERKEGWIEGRKEGRVGKWWVHDSSIMGSSTEPVLKVLFVLSESHSARP